MHFESFRGRDVTEALSLVRAAYGGDAVIGGTRVVTAGGGDLGSFVEVKAAAVDPGEPRRPSPKPKPFRAASAPRSAPAPAAAQGGHTLDAEISSLRALLEELMSAKKPKDQGQAILGAAGFEGPLVRELLSGALAPGDREAMVVELRERLRGSIEVVGCRVQGPEPVIVACVGPTGSGKTTTLAKLAAKVKFELGRTVSVVTLDTFRVGAIEQMKKFADLMEIPFSVAGDVDAFEEALAEHPADVILVDTPSRAPSDKASLGRLNACLDVARSVAATDVLLVVPSYLRTHDVERLASSYRTCQPTAVVLTKIDETDRLGGAVGGAIRAGLPFAYLSCGPRVPEDLSVAAADLADRCLPEGSVRA